MKQRFAAAIDALVFPKKDQKIAVAVSGGGDSMALALLMRDWAADHGVDIVALTVDHGLRDNSASEAVETGRILQSMGIAHRILRWEGDKPQTHVQERARAARYRLLADACRDMGISTLAVAHNGEDVAETFWMRLAHGSGLDGLAGIAARRESDDLQIIRPLLSFHRAELRDMCRDAGVAYIDDPSNTHPRYLRARLRPFEDVLALEGLTPARLARTLDKLSDAKEALHVVTRRLVESHVVFHAAGYMTMNIGVWTSEPRDLRRRIIATMIDAVSQDGYPPSFDALEDVCQRLMQGQGGTALHGCEVMQLGDDIAVLREEVAIEQRIAVAGVSTWDHRFAVGGFADQRLSIGALGEEGVSILRKKAGDMPTFETLPFKVKKTLPALWQDKNLVSVPYVSWVSGAEGRQVGEGWVRFAPKIHPPVKIV